MLFGSVVVKNESSRYLEKCLEHNSKVFDKLFVFDDRSTDDTVKIAERFADVVVVRPDSVPSFLEHEGKFRKGAWDAFVESMSPVVGDWVWSFDADEFIVSKTGDVSSAVASALEVAAQMNAVGVVVPFPEVFKVDGSGVWVRVDGFWGQVKGPRLFKFRDGAVWSDKPMGCGSEPRYVGRGPLVPDCSGVVALHFGYARRSDQVARHERYSSLFDHGHNDAHIQSIVKEPELVLWGGPVPEFLDSFDLSYFSS